MASWYSLYLIGAPLYMHMIIIQYHSKHQNIIIVLSNAVSMTTNGHCSTPCDSNENKYFHCIINCILTQQLAFLHMLALNSNISHILFSLSPRQRWTQSNTNFTQLHTFFTSGLASFS